MPVAAALFDLDGTLVDREPLMTAAVVQVCQEIGVDLGPGGAERWVGCAWPDLYTGLGVEASTGICFEGFMARIGAAAHDLESGGFATRHLPGAAVLIESLAGRGVPVGVVTGSMREEARRALAQLGVLERLDLVLTAEDYAPGKPHPACYLLAAERLGVAASSCVVFEDSQVGVAAARAAGMWTIGVTAANPPPGHPAHQDLRDAHVVVASLGDVTDAHLEIGHREGAGRA